MKEENLLKQWNCCLPSRGFSSFSSSFFLVPENLFLFRACSNFSSCQRSPGRLSFLLYLFYFVFLFIWYYFIILFFSLLFLIQYPQFCIRNSDKNTSLLIYCVCVCVCVCEYQYESSWMDWTNTKIEKNPFKPFMEFMELYFVVNIIMAYQQVVHIFLQRGNQRLRCYNFCTFTDTKQLEPSESFGVSHLKLI